MGAAEKREELHKYIDIADDRLINLMYGLVQADMTEGDYQLSDEHKRLIDSRMEAHEANPSYGSDWKEVKSRIKDQL